MVIYCVVHNHWILCLTKDQYLYFTLWILYLILKVSFIKQVIGGELVPFVFLHMPSREGDSMIFTELVKLVISAASS